MSSLLDSLNKGIEMGPSKSGSEGGDFPVKLLEYKDSVVNSYTRFNIGLNQGIAKIAQADTLNDDQISRIIEEVNNTVYLQKYAQLKSFPEREVNFDLANLPAIKGIMENGEQKVAHVIEKKASYENDDGDDALNFLSVSTHEMPGLGPEKRKDIKDILAEKIADESKDLCGDFNSAVSDLANSVYTVADALIKYDRAHKDAQSIFGNMCKVAHVTKAEQLIYKKAMNQKIGQMKEYKQLPEDYALELQLVDIYKESEFSMGNHSMIDKVAFQHKKVEAVPVIVTDNDTVIRNVQDLINIAGDIKSQKAKVVELGDKKKTLNIK